MSTTSLSRADAEAWCKAHRIPTNSSAPVRSNEMHRIEFSIPSDAGRRVALTGLIYPATWHPGTDVLVWVTQWSVWPSGEHLPLFRRFRQALGADVSLEEAPAQSFQPSDLEDGVSMMLLSCLFLWDSWTVCSNGSYVVQLSHDEWGAVYCRDEATHAELRQALDRGGFLSV